MNLLAKQKWRYTNLWVERGEGEWGELGDWGWPVHTAMYEMDN